MYTPIGDRVLIEVTQAEKTASGIYMPNISQENIKTGIVIAVGNGILTDYGVIKPNRIMVDDVVVFAEMNSVKVKLEGKDYYICKEPDILLVISK
jgi:chaperonin GroES